jgi:hypothetical protein
MNEVVMESRRTGPNRIDAARFGLGLIEQSQPDDEVCDEVCDEGPAITATNIRDVQNPARGSRLAAMRTTAEVPGCSLTPSCRTTSLRAWTCAFRLSTERSTWAAGVGLRSAVFGGRAGLC